MKTPFNLLSSVTPFWEEPGEGGGGGGGEGGEGGDKQESILDLGKKEPGEGGDKSGEGGDYVPPDFIPAHLHGTNELETLTKLNTAYKGARETIGKGKGTFAGEVPEKEDGYTFTDTGTEEAPDKVFAELTSEASKPMVALAQKAAHKIGLPADKFAEFMTEFVKGAGADGMPIGSTNEEAQEISRTAEMEHLTEMVGSAAEAGTIVNTVTAYGDKLLARGALSTDDMNEYNIMCGTAEGANVMYKIMVSELGEKAIPPADPNAGAVTSIDAYAAHAKASAMPEGAEKTAAMKSADVMMQKAFGQESSGSVPSGVL